MYYTCEDLSPKYHFWLDYNLPRTFPKNGERSVMRWIILLLLSATLTSAQGAPRRIAPIRVQRKLALVIGNAQYQHGALKNPLNDATTVAEALRRLGFMVSV